MLGISMVEIGRNKSRI